MTRTKQLIRRVWQDFYLVIIMAFLYAPIVTMMVLSFNSSKSRTQWGGFTLRWYGEMFQSSTIMTALQNTLVIAFASALIATVIGTAAAIVAAVAVYFVLLLLFKGVNAQELKGMPGGTRLLAVATKMRLL